MTVVRLDVYDVTNTTKLGTLEQAASRVMLADHTDPGACSFTVDLDATDDIDLLEPRRIVRWHVAGQDIESYIISDRPTVLAESGERPSMVVNCVGLLGWLGYSRGGALLYPRGGLDGLQQNPRPFGWMAADYNASHWTAPISMGTWLAPNPSPSSSNPTGLLRGQRPPGWPSPASHFLWTRAPIKNDNGTIRHPSGTCYFRGTLDMSLYAGYEGRARIYVIGGSPRKIFMDGDEVMDLSWGIADIFTRDIELEKGQVHLFAAQVRNKRISNFDERNNIGQLNMAVMALDDDGDPVRVLLRTDTSSRWKALDYPGSPPGVTAGFVASRAYLESRARGELPDVTKTFTALNDSAGQPWSREFTHAFRMQTLGRLTQDLSGLVPCEAAMTPTGEWQLFQRRGTNRTGTVTVTAPFGAQVTRDGPQLTRALYETPGGFGEAGTVGEANFGVMADLLTYGSGMDPDALEASVLDELDRHGRETSEVDVALPDDVVPYQDVFLGDTVTLAVEGFTGPVRITSFTLADDGTTGQPEWSATGVLDA